MYNNEIIQIQQNKPSCNDTLFRNGQYNSLSTPSFRARLPKNAQKQISDEALKLASKAAVTTGAAGIALYCMQGKRKIFDHDLLAQEIQKQLDEGVYYKQICKNLGISVNMYCVILKEYDIKTARRTSKENGCAVDENEFKQMVADNVPVSQIIQHFQITRAQYLRLLRVYGIKSTKMLNNEKVKNITKEEFEDAIKTSRSQGEVCRKLNISNKTYNHLKKVFGIDYDPDNPYEEWHNLTHEELKALAESDKSIAEKIRRYGISEPTYHDKLRRHNIKTKNQEIVERFDAVDIVQLQTDINSGLSKKELLERHNISSSQFQRLLDEGKIITHQKAMREKVLALTDEQIQRALNSSKNTREAAAKLQISKSELKKLIHDREGVTNPRTKNIPRQEYSQDFIDSFTQDVLSDMTISEVCSKYQISQNKYYKLINEFKIETHGIELKRKLAKLTTKQILKAINEADTHKSVYNDIGISKNTYAKLLKRHRIITEHQLAMKRTSAVTKEKLINGILEGKSLFEICQELGIGVNTCYVLLKKYNINYSKISERANLKEYEKYDIDTLKDCIVNLLMESKTVSDDKDLCAVLEFAFEKEYKTSKERQELVGLLRIINNVSLGNISAEQALKRPELKHQFAQIDYMDSISEILQTISELFRKQNDNISAEICLNYIPKFYKDTAKAAAIIDLIKANINPYEQNKQNDLIKLRKILICQNSIDNDKADSIINEAKKIYGNNLEKIGQYIVFDQILNGDFTYADFENDAFLFADRLKEILYDRKAIIMRLIKLEDYFNSDEAQNNSLTEFVKKFNAKGNYINKLITDFYIDNIYKNKVTVYEGVKDKDKRYFGGQEVTVIIYPEAKQKVLDYKKGKWDKYEFLIASDKYAQNFASAKFSTSGLKLFKLTENYAKDGFHAGDLVAEVKVSNDFDGCRLAAKRKNPEDKVIEIRYFKPDGFHE